MKTRIAPGFVTLRFLCLILCLAACHRKPMDQADHSRLAPGVKMQDVLFYSKALGRNMPYRVFLPENLRSGEQLPVVYLLHGGGEGFRNWSNESDVARYARAGLILVMPEGDESYYMNEVESPQNRFEDYITQDLIADVEGRFPARRDREGRAVIGISMGGFASVDYALMHPELFGFVGALSPSIDVPFRHFNMRRIDQWWKFRTIFGPTGSKERSDRNPFVLVRSVDPKTTPFIYLTAGEQEPLLDPNLRFAALLKQRNFAYEFHTKPGGHDWGQWNTQIPACFESLARSLKIQLGD
ncbi:MAG TPA: alpha/beta hydrolase-fold protein [Terracidiphilus sp.]|nr:alpha/beta hydrolase-fold protein [Terracidiphilus sp.]